jgi:hypothetical protein
VAENEEKHNDSADALDALASKDQVDGHTDALSALAEGKDLTVDEPADAPEAGEAAVTGDVVPTELVDQPAAEALAAGVPPIQVDPVARKIQEEKFRRQSLIAQHHQLKKFMIPLLLTVAVLLFVCGGLLVALMSTQGENGGKLAITHGLLNHPFGRFLVFASFPVGAILLLGAWVFHQDVRRMEKRQPES